MAAHLARRSDWVAFVASLVARGALGVLGSLLVWAVVPAAAGWHPTVVMTGSMLPRLVPGDVVFSRPVPVDQVRPRQVLLFTDPDHPGHLRLHRFVRTDAGGRLVTRGDANPTDDSTPVEPSAVRGVAAVRIPFVARPVLWAGSGDVAALAVLAAVLGALAAVATWFRPVPDVDGTRADPTEDDPTGGDVSGGGADDGATPTAVWRHPGTVVRLRGARTRAGRLLLAVGALVTAGVVFAATAVAAPFGSSTANPTSSFGAASYFTCTGAAAATGAWFAWPLSETSGGTAADVSGNGRPGTYSASGVTHGLTGPCRADRNGGGAPTAVGLTAGTAGLGSGSVSSSTAVTTSSTVSVAVWFQAAAGSAGGTLMSVTQSTNVTTLALALTATGRLVLGVTTGQAKTVSTSASDLRDGAWHLAVGTVGAAGLRLYVDTAAAVSNNGVNSSSSVAGTPRVGFGNHLSLGTGSTDSFTGGIAYAELYRSQLTATQVAGLFSAASA